VGAPSTGGTIGAVVANVTTKLKAKIMLAVLDLAPVGTSRPELVRMANDGNVPGLWRYYQNALGKRAEGEVVAHNNEIAFEMLQPAMKAVYQLPTSDGRE
jgi:hypothetical protein